MFWATEWNFVHLCLQSKQIALLKATGRSLSEISQHVRNSLASILGNFSFNLICYVQMIPACGLKNLSNQT